MEIKKTGANVMVCGSKEFQNRAFVYAVLDKTFLSFKIKSIISGEFSGVEQYAKEWAKERKIPYKNLNAFDEVSYSIFDGKRLPVAVLKHDKYFIQIQEKLIANGVSVLLTCPTNNGTLGTTTTNLMSMCKIIGIKVLPAELIFQKMECVKNQNQKPNFKNNLKEMFI